MTEDEADRLLEEFEIDDLAQQDMRDGMRRAGSTSPRTKIEKYDHHAFIAGILVELCPVNLLIGHGGRDSEEGESTADWVITYRLPNKQGTTWSVEDLLLRFKRHEMKTLGTLVWSLLYVLVDDCLDATAVLELRIEAAEGVIFGGETPDSNATKELQQELFNIRRDLLALQHKVQPMSDVAERLMTGDIEWIGTKQPERLREPSQPRAAGKRSADESDRAREERVRCAALARVAAHERDHEDDDGWGSIMLGAAFIAGLYGMNFTHMPELSWYPRLIRVRNLPDADPDGRALLLPPQARTGSEALRRGFDRGGRLGTVRTVKSARPGGRAGQRPPPHLGHDHPGGDREADRDHADHRVDGLERAVWESSFQMFQIRVTQT